jgi:hypothetical protein
VLGLKLARLIDYPVGFEEAHHLLMLLDHVGDRSDVDVALAKLLVYLRVVSLDPLFAGLLCFCLFHLVLASPPLRSQLQGVVRVALLDYAREM